MKSVKETQISYDIAYMWNLKKKNGTNEHIYKTETESQTENKLKATREGSRVGGGGQVPQVLCRLLGAKSEMMEPEKKQSHILKYRKELTTILIFPWTLCLLGPQTQILDSYILILPLVVGACL